MQKKTSGEVGNYIVVSWPVVYRIFVLKSIKIKSSVFKLQSKTSGTFFIGHSVFALGRCCVLECVPQPCI